MLFCEKEALHWKKTLKWNLPASQVFHYNNLMDNGLLLQYIALGLSLAVGFFVLADNPRNKLNHSFFVFTFGTALWIFFGALVFIEHRVACFGLMVCSAEFVVLGIVLLTKFFPTSGDNTWKIKRKSALFMFPWFVVFIFTILSYVIYPLRVGSVFNFSFYDIFFLSICLCVMLGYIAWSFVAFSKKYRALDPLMQISYFPFAIGIWLFVSAALVCDIILPFFRVYDFIIAGPLSSLFFVGFAIYAIIRYRFMEFRLVAKRAVVFTTIIFAVAFIYFGVHFIAQKFLLENDIASYPMSGFCAAVVCALLFPCIKREFEAATDHLFFRGEYDYPEAVRALGNIFCSALKLEDLLGSMGEIFKRTIKPSRVVFFIENMSNEPFFDAVSQKPLSMDSRDHYKKIVDDFCTLPPTPVFTKELEHAAKHIRHGKKKYYSLLASMNKARVGAVIPIFSKEKLKAILFLGGKQSGARFSKKDIELLVVVAHQAGMAIENAMLCVALERHMAEFEKKVCERTERMKNMYEGQSRFLADLSHEFQTPISILKGNIECLEKINNKKGKSEFYTIETTLDRLSRLIDNLLGVARLNFSKANLEKKQINVRKLLEEAYEDCRVLAKDKKIKLSFSSERCSVFGSADKLKEVLLNLISNALKYTTSGGTISLSGKIIDDEVEISVTDTGSGISPKNLPRVFERLYRVDGNNSGGTGLGLYICRQIVEAHGGTITVESKLGEGSRFIIRLPYPPRDSGKSAIL
jgi:signal transduction histidine kinase